MKTRLVGAGIAGVAGVVAAAMYGCGSNGDCTDTSTCIGDDGGNDGDAIVNGDVRVEGGDAQGDVKQGDAVGDGMGDGSGDGPCDKSGDPSGWMCPIGDADGVFVDSTNGHNGATGTKMDPLKKIQDGIAKAAMGLDRVFVCAGNYDEHLTMSVAATTDGVGVYGGWDCTQWQYAAGNHVKVAPTTTGYVVEVDNLTKGATFEDLELDAHDGVADGDSSIAVFANNSMNAVIKRATIVAGAGVHGVDAAPATAFGGPAQQGNDGTTLGGGMTVDFNCANGTGSGTGGAGGQPAPTGADGIDGTPLGSANHGKASAQSCASGSTGNNGDNGVGGATGGAGASALGMVDGTGWFAFGGASGMNGVAAQGGGGGASLDPTGGGGGGGAGGCGGVGGGAGGGGGGSIALLSYQSQLALASVVVQTGAAGHGGDAASGQVAQVGGSHGSATTTLDAGTNNACPGGPGGSGGSGAGGGGGAGGVSVGVLWKSGTVSIDGTPVTADEPTVNGWTIGAKGDPGALGMGGVAAKAGTNIGADGTAGADGAAAAVMKAP
jgi:hypothetical protein